MCVCNKLRDKKIFLKNTYSEKNEEEKMYLPCALVSIFDTVIVVYIGFFLK